MYPPAAMYSAPMGSATPAYPVPAYPAGEMTFQNPYSLYSAGGAPSGAPSHVPQAAIPSSRPAGLEGLVAAQRAKASRINADVHEGFRDLEVLLSCCLSCACTH
jgi:hypothetical protein